MQTFKIVYLFENEKRYLIDYANIKQGLISDQKDFLGKKDVKKNLKDISRGIPFVLPIGLKCFNYNNVKEIFRIDTKKVFGDIFRINNFNYKPAWSFLEYGNFFCVGGKPKKKYDKLISFIIDHNNKLKDYIKKLQEKKMIVAAFQTRNIPHLGHEEIIKHLLKKSDHVVINPVIGPKKKGDTNYFFLKKIYNFLINKKYKNNVSYFPVIANMFYAGPREAMHHTFIRQNLGFDIFCVGRDHAGAEFAYNPNLSIKTALKYRKNFRINLIATNGAYYCKYCKKIVIKGSCKKSKIFCNLQNISGTDFRKKISKKKFFKFADKDIQTYMHGLKKNIFV